MYGNVHSSVPNNNPKVETTQSPWKWMAKQNMVRGNGEWNMTANGSGFLLGVIKCFETRQWWWLNNSVGDKSWELVVLWIILFSNPEILFKGTWWLCMHACMGAKLLQFCLTLCNLMEPARLLCPWESLNKNTGVGCHALLQEIFLTQGSNFYLLHLLHWQMGSLAGRFFMARATWEARVTMTRMLKRKTWAKKKPYQVVDRFYNIVIRVTFVSFPIFR